MEPTADELISSPPPHLPGARPACLAARNGAWTLGSFDPGPRPGASAHERLDDASWCERMKAAVLSESSFLDADAAGRLNVRVLFGFGPAATRMACLLSDGGMITKRSGTLREALAGVSRALAAAERLPEGVWTDEPGAPPIAAKVVHPDDPSKSLGTVEIVRKENPIDAAAALFARGLLLRALAGIPASIDGLRLEDLQTDAEKGPTPQDAEAGKELLRRMP